MRVFRWFHHSGQDAGSFTAQTSHEHLMIKFFKCKDTSGGLKQTVEEEEEWTEEIKKGRIGNMEKQR